MKKMLMVVCVLLLSASCVELRGNFELREPLNVKKKTGFLNLKTKIITLAPGAYQAKLVAKSSSNLNLELKGGSVGEVDIPIKSDDSLNLPTNGQFYIAGSKIGQPFNVSGVISTEVRRWGHTDVTERCERQVVERRCEKVCAQGARECEVVCKDVTVTFQGLKDISYHYKTTDRAANLELMPENSTAVVARMAVDGSETDKIIDRETSCR